MSPVAVTPSPVGGGKVVVCHWNNGGGWDAIEVSTSALEGHNQHSRDIWPPVDGVTEGQNWPDLEKVWLNQCALNASPIPTPTPTSTATATQTLPETGPVGVLIMSLTGIALLIAGMWLLALTRRNRR